MTDNFDKYKILLKELSREANQAIWTSGSWLIVIIFLLLIGATIIARIFIPFANMLVMFFIFLAEVVALLIPILVCHHKVDKYMHNRCIELELNNPGLSEAYEEWKQRFKDITSNN
jgi:hypothetical protein